MPWSPRNTGPPIRVQSLIAPADRKSPADCRAATEFIARNDADYPARAVKNGDGRYWLFVTRKPDLVHDRSSTHRQPPSSDAYLRPFEAQGVLSDRDVRMFSQESARGPRAAHAKQISLAPPGVLSRTRASRQPEACTCVSRCSGLQGSGDTTERPRKSGARCGVHRPRRGDDNSNAPSASHSRDLLPFLIRREAGEFPCKLSGPCGILRPRGYPLRGLPCGFLLKAPFPAGGHDVSKKHRRILMSKVWLGFGCARLLGEQTTPIRGCGHLLC